MSATSGPVRRGAGGAPVVHIHSEERFRLLVESVLDYAIFMLDPEGRVATWNAGAQRIKGYRADEIIGRSFETFYPAAAVESGWPREELRRAIRDGRYEEEGWRLRKDGSRFWAAVVITALRDEQGVLRGFAKVTRDLTDRRRQEEALRQSEEQLRLLIGSVKDYAIFMLDTEGRVLTWNAGAAAIKGYRADQVLFRHFDMFFTPDDIAAGKPQRELVAARTYGRSESEGWRVRRDGSVFWANIVITPVVDGDGQLRGYAKVTRDLTEQRRLMELEHSSRRMNEFIAMLAHEMRNPLAPIGNAVSMMQMLRAELPPSLLPAGDIMQRQLTHLTRLVDDLLDVGRIVTGKIHLKSEPVDFREVVQATVAAVRSIAEDQHQLRLLLTLPDEPIPMTGDATRLSQSLHNLINNALRYTPPGGTIRVDVEIDGVACITTITDTGRGIAPQALERIFELFVQEDAPDAPPREGLGIGLALARTLVERHGGMLSAHSPGLGHGSTFTMRLPVRTMSAATADSPGRADIDASESLDILVVDDNRDSTDTMVEVLELLGHRARGVYGATDAVRAVGERVPNVVLLDLNMPGGDGFSVLEQIGQRYPGRIYFAAMTGYGQQHDRLRTLEAGFQAHLTKPVGIEQLRQILRAAASVRTSPTAL